MLGSGPEIEIIDAACIAELANRTAEAGDPKKAKLYADTARKGDPESWQTSAAQVAKANARAAGRIPLLRRDYEHTCAMAEALRRHPLASKLFDPSCGKPEQSLFWHDGEWDIDRRSRLDWLPGIRDGLLILGGGAGRGGAQGPMWGSRNHVGRWC